MKESIASVIIIAVIIFICFSSVAFMDTFCNEITSTVMQCIEAANENDWALAEKHIETTRKIFDSKTSSLKLFSKHQELNEIFGSILQIESAIKLRSRELCINESNGLLTQINKISDSDHPKIYNIL